MRKTILLTTLAIILTNCGGGGSSSNGISLNFDKKEVATYDLKEYLFDLQNRDINITETTYTNKNGQKDYTNLPSSEIKKENHTHITKIDDNIIKEYKDSKLDSTSTIYENKIEQVSDEINATIVRYVDVGDYFTDWSKTQKLYGGTMKGEMICKIDAHQDSMIVGGKEFMDILKIDCDLKIDSDGKTEDNRPFNLSSNSDHIVYVAKGIGEIKSIDDGCQVVKVSGEIEENECEKVEGKIENIK